MFVGVQGKEMWEQAPTDSPGQVEAMWRVVLSRSLLIDMYSIFLQVIFEYYCSLFLV